MKGAYHSMKGTKKIYVRDLKVGDNLLMENDVSFEVKVNEVKANSVDAQFILVDKRGLLREYLIRNDSAYLHVKLIS